MLDSGKPVVFVYRSKLLRFSETFILAQMQAMRKFRPFLVGVNRLKGLEIPQDSIYIGVAGQNNSSPNNIRYKLFGPTKAELTMLRQYGPKLIHAHFGPDAAEALPLARKLGIPLVATFHGYDAMFANRLFPESIHDALYMARLARLRNRGFCFIAVSSFIRDKLLGQGFNPDRLLIHYIGIDTERFHPDPDVKREPIVLFVGRLTEKKGCSLLIRAMQVVQQTAPEMRLVIVGDGALRNQLEQQCRGTLTHYSFVGVQNSSQVCEWMQRATVFCVPSISASNGDAEGFGMVFAEAQACGLPVVSFASGGIPDAVAHGETGFLAPEGNWQVLAGYLLQLISNSELWNAFSLAGQTRVREKFNVRNQTVLLERIYSELIVEWSQKTNLLK